MPLYEYRCKNGHLVEKLQKSSTEYQICPNCGKKAMRVLSIPSIKLEGWSGSFPGAALKWDRDHKKLHEEAKE